MHHSKLVEHIDQLRDLFAHAQSQNKDWNKVWAQVRLVASTFRQVRYPSQEERTNAWNKFQQLVSEIKAQNEERTRQRASLTEGSRHLRAQIEGLVDSALNFQPSAADNVADIAGPGKPGATDLARRREVMDARYAYLNDAWNTFKGHKDELTPADQGQILATLKHAQGALRSEWDRYKQEREAAAEQRQRQREARLDDRRRRIEANIDKNLGRVARRYQALEVKAKAQSYFQGLRSTARTDEFRAAMDVKLSGIAAEISGDGRIVRVTSPLDHSVTHGNLCIKGRFGWQFVQIQKAPETVDHRTAAQAK